MTCVSVSVTLLITFEGVSSCALHCVPKVVILNTLKKSNSLRLQCYLFCFFKLYTQIFFRMTRPIQLVAHGLNPAPLKPQSSPMIILFIG